MSKIIRHLSILIIFAFSLANNVSCKLYKVQQNGETVINSKLKFVCKKIEHNYRIKIIDYKTKIIAMKYGFLIETQFDIPVNHIIYTKNSNFIGLLLDDNSCIIYDIRYNKSYKTIDVKSIKIKEATISGKFLIIEYDDHTFDLFNINSGLKINNQNKEIYHCETMGNILIIKYDDYEYRDNEVGLFNIDLFNITSGQKINQKQKVYGYDTKGNILIIKYNDHTLDLFNITSGQKINPQNKKVYGYDTKGNILIIKYDDLTLDLFFINKVSVQRINQNRTVYKYVTKGNFLIIKYDDHTLDLFNINSGLQINTQNKKIYHCETIGTILIIKYDDHTLDLFNINSGLQINNQSKKNIQVFHHRQHSSHCRLLA